MKKQKWSEKPITWGGYLKLCGVCSVISVLMTAYYWCKAFEIHPHHEHQGSHSQPIRQEDRRGVRAGREKPTRAFPFCAKNASPIVKGGATNGNISDPAVCDSRNRGHGGVSLGSRRHCHIPDFRGRDYRWSNYLPDHSRHLKKTLTKKARALQQGLFAFRLS